MESVVIVSIVLLLLSGPILVKGQGPVCLFGKNVTLPCVSATPSVGEQFTWNDQTDAVTIYVVNGADVKEKTFDARNNEKYDNFNIYNNYSENVNLLINSLEIKDAGIYNCKFLNQASPDPLTVRVEALPLSVSISCERSLSTDCVSPFSPTSDSFSCNCTAIGAYPRSLQFDWSGGATGVQQSQMNNTERNGTVDFYTNADIVPTENSGHVTCTLNGYEGTWSEGDRKAVYNINPPMCVLKSICNDTNTGVSLTCTCTDASPAEGLVYSFFDDGELLSSGDSSVFEAAIEMGQEYIFGCRGCNGVNYGSTSYVTQTVTCKESTTALPTTTITTVPLSTKEPTSTKATDATTNTMHTEDSTTESTTEKSGSTTTDEPDSGGLGPGAIVGICCAALAVIIVIVVIALIVLKPGEGGSKSESDKPDNNGAGPGVDPEIPGYGVIDKNRTNDPTPVPLSSMRDSTNSSKPKQPNEIKYAVIDHSNKPPSDEVIKPKEESTE